ncbi:MAG: WYL domain-containing protein [Paludibacteraceae bacterium]|nr:WYL domain-containing protein [Paludibacteraceae bacterium]
MANQLNNYIWLADTIYKAGKISLEQINDKRRAQGYDPIPERTFHKWRKGIEEMLDIDIACERKNGYRYYIENNDDLKNGSLRNWLLNTMSTSNLLVENKNLKHRIMVEDIPSGRTFLQPIIEAIKNNHQLELTYQRFTNQTPHTNVVNPYCLRLNKQRWYLLAEKVGVGLRTYSLDRFQQLKELDSSFLYPKDFDPNAYFYGCSGIIADPNYPVQRIRIKVKGMQANYLRTLKLHESQTEIERNNDFSIFELYVRPTFDFVQELMMQGADLEVLEPDSLRQQLLKNAQRLVDMYQQKK